MIQIKRTNRHPEELLLTETSIATANLIFGGYSYLLEDTAEVMSFSEFASLVRSRHDDSATDTALMLLVLDEYDGEVSVDGLKVTLKK
jgi:hypothetical protein